MRILTVLTYYRPHTSGLTIYAERLASALAARGHRVTVLTSRFAPDLPAREVRDGVTIRRVPVLARIGKGVVMPTLGVVATREVLRHDAVILHLPQLDAAGIALRGRLLGRPTVITYHCDLILPPGALNRFVQRVVDLANELAARACHHVVAYTEDYAEHSPYLRRHCRKRVVILPPVEIAAPAGATTQGARDGAGPGPVLGMAARLASEKGVEVLLDALPAIQRRFPDVRVAFAGQHRDVWGESEYADRLRPRLEPLQRSGAWRFLGVLSPSEMSLFYRDIDLLLVPSLNSTESFGLVQIEAMLHGVPCVASDLPGVRQPVALTGMGEIAPAGDAPALAAAVIRALDSRERYRADPAELAARFSPDRCARAYEELLAPARPAPSAGPAGRRGGR